MNNKFIFLILFFCLLFPFKEVKAVNASNYSYTLVDENCGYLFGDPDQDGSVANWLQKIFNFIKFLGPALVVVLSIIDFFKAIIDDNKDALIKAGKSTVTRIILALILFFLPYIINFLFRLFRWYGTCGIS